MARVDGVRWDELSRTTREAIMWARAAEKAAGVGTRGLLLGMLRGGERPPNQLLRHFSVDEARLFEALQRQVPEHALDTQPAEPVPLDDFPALTVNARKCFERAAELRHAAPPRVQRRLQHELPNATVSLPYLFAAILDTRASTAFRALADVISDVPLDDVRARTLEWLYGSDLKYEDVLRRAFPQPARTVPKVPFRNFSADRDMPWPFLAVMRRHAPPNGPARFRATGLGFVAEYGILVTVARSAEVADALAHLPHDDSEHEFRTLANNATLVALALTPPPALLPTTWVTTAGQAQACRVATIDDQFLDITMVDGIVGEADDPGEGFTVKLQMPLSEDRTATGSPVITSDGEIIGIVGPTGTNRSVNAYGSAAIARVLAAAEPTPSPLIATGTLSGAGNDVVGDVDQLKFGTYVTAFADLITSQHTQPPLTIGIFGSWGMGKSFLLTHIEREIESRHTENRHAIPQVHVVRFNAWEYSSMDIVWPALVRTIVSRLDKLSTWPWHRRLWTRVRWNLARQWRQLWPRLVAGAIVVGALIAAALMNNAADIAKAIGGVAAALGVAGVLKAAKDPVANWVTTLFADSDYGDQLRVMKDIKHDLTTLEQRLHQDGNPKKPVTGRILILIDDLDRCEPSKAVEVLQALNLLLNFNSFIIVLGIDARIVSGAIEKHYEGLLGKAGASGYEYLDKIVQIPFRIPEPAREEIITFVAGQLGNPAAPQPPPERGPPRNEPEPEPEPSDEPVHPFGEEELPPRRESPPLAPPPAAPPAAEVPFTYDEQQAFALFADHLRPNPRHLKRLVNVYRLVRALAASQREPLILARPAATIRWLVMWGQWPYTSLRMVDRYEELFDQHGAAIAENVGVDEPMLHLLDHVEQSLDADMRNRLDDPPDELRKLLSIPGCGFAWDEIRRIRPYTVNFNPAVEEQVRHSASPPPTG